MIIGDSDIESIQKVTQALAGGLRRAETELPSQNIDSSEVRRIVGYYVTNQQIRIDIIDGGIK